MVEPVSKSGQPEVFHHIAEGDQRKAVSWFSGKGDVLRTIHQADFGAGFEEPDVDSLQHGMKQQAKVAETHVPSTAEGTQNTNLFGASLPYGILEGKLQIGLILFPWKPQDFRSFIFGFPEPFRVDGIHVSNKDIGPSSYGRTHPIAAVCGDDPVFRLDEAINIAWRQQGSACKDDDLAPVGLIQGSHFQGSNQMEVADTDVIAICRRAGRFTPAHLCNRHVRQFHGLLGRRLR